MKPEKVRFGRLEEEQAEFEEMVLGLYQEDPAGEAITREKIRGTIHELERHPEKGTIIVFRVDEAVVGYAILIFYWSNEWGGDIINVDELYVKPAWRNQGIATVFFERLQEGEFGEAVALALEVTPTNEGVRRYYQKLGFELSENRHLVKIL